MLATVCNLPKWLFVAVVFCVMFGHLEQAQCRVQGCGSLAAKSVEKTSSKGSTHPDGEPDGCGCACHFGTLALLEALPSFVVLHAACVVKFGERYDGAPEAPCAEIEYPPRASRA